MRKNGREAAAAKAECSARELVHTEVAVSMGGDPSLILYQVTLPSLCAETCLTAAATAAGNGQRRVVRAEVRCRSGNSR